MVPIGKLEYGRVIANPDQLLGEKSMVQLEHSDYETVRPAKDVLGPVTTTGNLSSITFNGITYTPEGTIAYNDIEGVKAFIAGVVSKFEFNVFLNYYLDGDNKPVLEHIGKLRLSAIDYSDGAPVSATVKSTPLAACDYKLSAVGAITALSYGEATDAIANGPFAFSGTPATDATTAGTLKTELTGGLTALGITNATVTVTPNTVTSKYDIVITAPKLTQNLKLQGVKFEESNCRIEFF